MDSRALEAATPRNAAEASAAQRSKAHHGFSPAGLARMHDALHRHVSGQRLPGLVALVSRRGAEHLEAIGTLGFDRTEPMRRDTIFRMASVTKPMVARMIKPKEMNGSTSDWPMNP